MRQLLLIFIASFAVFEGKAATCAPKENSGFIWNLKLEKNKRELVEKYLAATFQGLRIDRRGPIIVSKFRDLSEAVHAHELHYAESLPKVQELAESRARQILASNEGRRTHPGLLGALIGFRILKIQGIKVPAIHLIVVDAGQTLPSLSMISWTNELMPAALQQLNIPGQRAPKEYNELVKSSPDFLVVNVGSRSLSSAEDLIEYLYAYAGDLSNRQLFRLWLSSLENYEVPVKLSANFLSLLNQSSWEFTSRVAYDFFVNTQALLYSARLEGLEARLVDRSALGGPSNVHYLVQEAPLLERDAKSFAASLRRQTFARWPQIKALEEELGLNNHRILLKWRELFQTQILPR